MASSRAVGLLLAASLTASAAEPSLKHLAPVAGQQGTTVSVIATGKFDPWPVKAWVDAPGINIKAGDKAGKFDVEIAKDAAPGPHLVRFFNDAGASATRFFIVSTDPELADTEPNDDFKAPQKIAALPATISGKLDKAGDVDSFAVTLKKRQSFVAWLEGYVLASTFDGLLRIVDERGTELAFNHDGRTLDPLLTWTAPRDGTFIVQAMGFVYPGRAEVGLTGGEGCIYRLHLSTTAPTPAEQAGTAEIEPNDSADKAQAFPLPGVIAGRIERRGDEDRFSFTAVKQRGYEFAVSAARDGSPLDAWLKIEAKDGKQLARADDNEGTRDPKLTWTAPSDGVFTVAVGDVTHRGGAEYAYRLSAAEAKPSIAATVGTDSFVVKSDKPAEAKVTVKRANGFKAKLKLAAKNLPEGVTAAEVDVPEKDGEVTLKLTAAADVKPANQPIQLVLRETEGGAEHIANFPLIKTTEDNGVPQGYSELVIKSVDQLWLTVIAAPAPKPEPPKTELAAPSVAK